VTPPPEVAGHDPFSASYRAEWEHFLEVVRGQTAAPPLADHVKVHETLEAIERSAREGREITP
jgi:predicted dehydrogenase